MNTPIMNDTGEEKRIYRAGVSYSPYFTPEQVAGVLGVHRNTVVNWIKAGRLPAVKIGPRSLRISPEALEEFLDASSTAK